MNTKLDSIYVNSFICIIYLIFIFTESTQGLENTFKKHFLSYLVALFIVSLVIVCSLIYPQNVNIPELSNLNYNESSIIKVIHHKFITSKDLGLVIIPLIAYLFSPLSSLSPYILVVLVPMMFLFEIFRLSLINFIVGFGLVSISTCLTLVGSKTFNITSIFSTLYYIYVMSSSIFSCGVLILLKVMFDNNILFSRKTIISLVVSIKVIHKVSSYLLPPLATFISNFIYISIGLLLIYFK